MTAHVFVVDSISFKVHLEYLFVGTGAKDLKPTFNNSTKIPSRKPQPELLLVSMMADLARVRKGDEVFFYCQKTAKGATSSNEGRFYGVFEIADEEGFLTPNSAKEYLHQELGKRLSFRVKIKPKKVFAQGLTEWEALDYFDSGETPDQMLWSLIYRKLRGLRGNTMITLNEAKILQKRISQLNENKPLLKSTKGFSFDPAKSLIVETSQIHVYKGKTEKAILEDRLISRMKNGLSFEAHLQQVILKNLGNGTIQSLDSCLLQGGSLKWLGNEVACGVGMQKIDILVITKKRNKMRISPIELKGVHADAVHVSQIEKYLEWISLYLLPNNPGEVTPVLVTMQKNWFRTPRDEAKYEAIWTAIDYLDGSKNSHTMPLLWLEFSVETGKLAFRKPLRPSKM